MKVSPPWKTPAHSATREKPSIQKTRKPTSFSASADVLRCCISRTRPAPRGDGVGRCRDACASACEVNGHPVRWVQKKRLSGGREGCCERTQCIEGGRGHEGNGGVELSPMGVVHEVGEGEVAVGDSDGCSSGKREEASTPVGGVTQLVGEAHKRGSRRRSSQQ